MENRSQSARSSSAILSLYEYVGCIVLFVIYIFRKLPFIQYNGEINPDESQMLTQAVTLEFDPVFWRSVDGTTAGPINSYLLLALKYIGFPFNYITLHLASVGLITFSLFMTYLTLRLFLSTRISFLSILIPYSFFLFANHKDFNHYNSELPSVALITVAFFLLAQLYSSNNSSYWIYAALGAVCCLIPLAKLQGGPLAFLYLICAALIALNSKSSPKILPLLALSFGALVVLGGLLVFLYRNSILYDFYIMYIKTNLSHSNPGNGLKLFIQLLFKSSYDYLYFILFSAHLWVLAAILGYRNNPHSIFYNRTFWVLLINVALSLYVIARTGYIFEHYLFYTFFPITILTAYSLNELLESGVIKSRARFSFNSIVIGLFAGIAVIYALKVSKKNQNFTIAQSPVHETKVVNLIKHYSKPTDCLVVWGWNLNYHVLTGLRQGTKENHSIRCMTTNALGAIHDPELVAYYGREYLKDMAKNRPAVFIDEVRANSFFEKPDQVIHQTVPGLEKLVAENYKLVSDESGVLVYVRNDRL